CQQRQILHIFHKSSLLLGSFSLSIRPVQRTYYSPSRRVIFGVAGKYNLTHPLSTASQGSSPVCNLRYFSDNGPPFPKIAASAGASVPVRNAKSKTVNRRRIKKARRKLSRRRVREMPICSGSTGAPTVCRVFFNSAKDIS